MFYSAKAKPSEGSLGEVQLLLRTVVPWVTLGNRKDGFGLSVLPKTHAQQCTAAPHDSGCVLRVLQAPWLPYSSGRKDLLAILVYS